MNLSGTQLKDTYGNLVTTGTSAGSPTTGGLQNGDGTLLTSVGIGTNSPSAVGSRTTLNISGSAGSAIRLSDDTANAFLDYTDGSGVRLSVNTSESITFRTNSADKMTLDSSGNLGIGTTSPSVNLDIEDSSNVLVDINTTTANANTTIRFQEGGTAKATIGYDGTNNGLILTSGGFTAGNGIFIDDSQNVGIGTTSPTNYTNFTTLAIGDSVQGGVLELQYNGTQAARIAAVNPNTIALSTNDIERLRIDSSGNVGIGVSPSALLSGDNVAVDVGNSNGGEFVARRSGGQANLAMGVTGGDVGYLYSTTNTPMVFGTNNAEAMRIDSSGNVLVGKTTTALATVGTSLFDDGTAYHTVDGNVTMRLNRLTSDGDIIDFRKDTTTVGSIGVTSGSFAIGQTNTGIGFFNGDRIAFPATSAGAVQDNAIDLGYASGRFKDLYLGGSVYLGGTTSANALDDYEEGTFDLTLGGSTTDPTTTVTTTANYTKIGNVVHYNFTFNNVDTTGASGNITFSGFPFTTTSTNIASGNCSVHSIADFNGGEYLNLYIGSSSTTGELLGSRTNTSWVNAIHNAGSGRYLNASITVHVV